MGILKSLFTLGKSFISQAEESIEETQGVRMLEQHIRDAKAELDKAGKSRVDLLARTRSFAVWPDGFCLVWQCAGEAAGVQRRYADLVV